MKITRQHLRRIIKEYAEALPGIAVPSWPEKHFAWREAAFTRDGDVRYILDIADPETVSAANSIGEPFPPGTNVSYIRGAFNPDGIPGRDGNAEKIHLHDSELLALIDEEGWHLRPPPEGAGPGMWAFNGEWIEDPEPGTWDLPPDEDMIEPLVEKRVKITKRQLCQIVEQHMADWYDEEMGYETMADRKYADSLDDDLEDDGYGDSEYDRGYQDALEGFGIAHDATPEYEAGFEDGKLDSDMEDEWALQDQMMAEGITLSDIVNKL